nr:MAG TPA: Minor capsid protein from bacteriophage [Caudoviricetes sp.]
MDPLISESRAVVAESEQISRSVLSWLNKWPDKPYRVDFEYLNPDAPCLTLSTIQAAYKTKKYIDGSYEAQYQFKIAYRLQPTGNNERLNADEVLNAMADWACSTTPDLGEGKNVRAVECNSRSSLFARYDNGSEDHQILMTMKYEVI